MKRIGSGRGVDATLHPKYGGRGGCVTRYTRAQLSDIVRLVDRSLLVVLRVTRHRQLCENKMLI